MKKGRNLITLSMILAFLLGSSLVYGQSEADKKKAKKLFKEGVTYFESGKHAQALEAFQKSYKLRPHWAIRFNLGLCYKELGMYTKAKEEFHMFLDEGGKKVKPETEKEVEKELTILNGIIALIEIDVNVEGAEIWMDGKFFSNAPLEDKIGLDPGSHLIAIHQDGYESYEEEFILSKGERKSFRISLLPTEGTDITDTKKDKKKDKKKGGAEGGDDTPKTKKKWALPVFIATLSLAVASAGAGSAMLGLAFQKKGEMDDLDKKMTNNNYDGTYDQYKKDRNDIADQGKLFVTMMWPFYAIAAASAAAAVVTVFIGHPFAKSEIEAEPTARKKLLRQMGVALMANGKENVLLFQMSF